MMNIFETLDYVKSMHGKTNALDKTGQAPYYWHLLRVMLRIDTLDENCQKVALLHDVLEDTPATHEELVKLFGNQVADDVKWCSKNYFKDLSFVDWMKKISNEAPDNVILAKLADISDNLSYERMRGLMPSPEDIPVRKKEPLTLQKRIDISTRKKMKLRGEMGVYDRYYKAWNIIMENPKNQKFLEFIQTGDFVDFNQFKKLSYYIHQDELSQYLAKNKIHTWKISGEIKVINDKGGSPYVVLDVPVDIGSIYQKYLSSYQTQNYFENQQLRDKNSFHVTLVNVAEYSLIKKQNNLHLIDNFFNKKTFDFYSYGIGKAEKSGFETFYIILESNEIDLIRKNLDLKHRDMHTTIAFNPKDVHGVSKSRETVIYSNDLIWNFLVKNKFENNSIKKLNFTL